MTAQLFYRYSNNNEKSFFHENKSLFEGVIAGAHIVALYEESLFDFFRILEKPLLIDPYTYVFTRSLKNIKRNNEIKKSFSYLLEQYPNSISPIIQKRQLIPKDFREQKSLVNDFTSDTIEFQKKFFSKSVQTAISDYMAILNQEETSTLKPAGLIAPYFYFDSQDDPWYEINIQCVKKANSIKADYQLYPVICFDKDLLLDNGAIETIVEDYKNFDGIFLWISDFDENDEPKQYLLPFGKLVRKFEEKKVPLYNFYGSYFSLLLTKFGLKGYCRGIAQSEKRDIDLCIKGGGGAPERYYIPNLHQYSSRPNLEAIMTDNPELLCKCEICEKKWKKLQGNTSAQKITEFFRKFDYFSETREHFLTVHWQEKQRITSLNKNEITKMIEDNIKQLENLNLKDHGININYIKSWLEVIQELI
ncbi:MAG: hypothetical protein GF308_00500 [Candidatus Heimdallarchaeota archaeon]|nr:hypothetical protein [Candidatus Heimdallarchaeota archaeon]